MAGYRGANTWEKNGAKPRRVEWWGGDEQLAWLKETLIAARKTGERVIVFTKIYGHKEVDIPHINLVGMVDTHENAYAIATFCTEGITLKGFGRQNSESERVAGIVL